MNINKVHLAGHLTRDPELRVTRGGLAVCELGLAVNERWKDEKGEPKEKAHFFDLFAYGKLAEVLSKQFSKGAPIYVEGTLSQDRWKQAPEGGGEEKIHSRVKIRVDEFSFLESKANADARRSAE